MNILSTTAVLACVSKEQFEKARAFLLLKLQKELPSHLTYHNAAHTEGVINATAYLLQREGVPENDKWLLLTAALFHDAGFLRAYDNHEELSCDVAWETLPGFGYCKECIDAICRLIRVTKMPQMPLSHYEKIICDADLYYLGTVKFSVTARQLYKEWKAAGHVQNKEEWMTKQMHFLNGHRYFTDTAQAEMEPMKRGHIRNIQKQVKKTK
jgi:uncharacterized protein